jgi:hypothetical protein
MLNSKMSLRENLHIPAKSLYGIDLTANGMGEPAEVRFYAQTFLSSLRRIFPEAVLGMFSIK